MRSRLLTRLTLAAAGLVVFAGVRSAEAQITGPVEFTTTFPFSVGNATVAAGRYTIRPDDDNPQILELNGPHTAVFFEVTNLPGTRKPEKTEIVFNHNTHGYVLKDVRIEGSGGVETLTAEVERHHAKAGKSTNEYVPAKKAGKTTGMATGQ
jgi:hypothetical protein